MKVTAWFRGFRAGVAGAVGGFIGVSIGVFFTDIPTQSFIAGAAGGFIGAFLGQVLRKSKS